MIASNKVVNFDRDVTIEGEENLFVGYGGKVYISDIKNLTLLKGTACEGDECCNFEVPINSDSKEPILDLGGNMSLINIHCRIIRLKN